MSNAKLLALVKSLSRPQELECIRTGIHAIDLLLGDGVPVGKVLEVFGPEQGGKSLFAWHAAKAFQSAGGVAVLYDVEATAPRRWMGILGVREDLMVFRRQRRTVSKDGDKSKIVDRGLDSIESITRDMTTLVPALRKLTEGPILVIWDSVAAACSEDEWEKKSGGWEMSERGYFALRAKAMSINMPRIVPMLADNRATLMAINQIREKPGVMYGKKTDTPGGKALKFYSTIRLEFTRMGRINKEGKYVGVEVRAKVEKTKLTEPFREVEMKVNWTNGFEAMSGLPEVLEKANRIQPGKVAGHWQFDKVALNTRNLPELVERRKDDLLAAWL
jgi:recombination protein RecA